MKKFLIILSFFMCIFAEPSLAESVVKAPGFTRCFVNTTSLNMRCGPSKNYSIVKTLKYGTELKAIGKITNWYIVQTKDDTIGMVSGWYISPITTNDSGSRGNSSGNTSSDVSNLTMTADEETIFNLVNEARVNAGLSKLIVDKELLRVARIKSQDMADSNYFSHNSPTYGTPFQMIKNFGISYKSAGENIAGNSSVEAAFRAWMNSSGHKANILGNSFTHTGIGIVNSPKYGKIFTQMFVGK